MQYSNLRNLPAPLCAAIRRDTYDKGDSKISCTGLLMPPRIAALTDTFDDMIVRDYSSEVWSLFGRAVHHIIENSQTDGYTMEERYFTDVEGWRISGQIDARQEMNDGSSRIIDWKTRKAYAVMNGRESDEQQLNIYAWLMRKNDKEVIQLQIVNIIRDHSSFEAERNPSYPQREVVVTDIDLWTFAEQERFVKEKIQSHQIASISLPECTPEERWIRPSKFAVQKTHDSKRAFKLFNNGKDAKKVANEKGYIVEERKGEPIRCQRFCEVSEFCEQYQSELINKQGE